MIESKPSSVMAPVLGFPSYLVSREGVVYRKDSMRALAQQKSRKGYLTVNMSEGGRATRLSVHRVVLESFVGVRPEGMQALHGDGNPSNNHLENLRWGNASENEADKLLHGTKAMGSRNGASRLTEEMVNEILEAKRVGGKEWGAGRLAKKFGVAVSTVVRAGRGKHWASSRAALATQPAAGEPKPIGYIHDRWKDNLEGVYHFTTLVRDKHKGWETPVFLTPPAAPPVAAGEPVAWIIESPEGCSPCKSINHLKHMAERYAAVGWSVTPLYAAPPAAAHGDSLSFSTAQELATAIRQVAAYEDLGPELIAEEMFKQAGAAEAAHGDEAVQYRLLRVGEVIQATDELLRYDCTTWQPMSDGPQIGIGWDWHAGLVPVRRIDAAMRAQGDGDADHA